MNRSLKAPNYGLNRALALTACVFSGLLILIFLVSCKRSGELKTFVDVPITLEQVKALEKTGALVQIERTEKSQGGGACGHSPVCLIVIPFVLLNSIFPERYDLVTVTEKGQITYSGMFTTKGEFIQARVISNNTARDIRRLDLEELNKQVVVEIASSKLDANGKPGEMNPTPILAQTHLDQEYSAAMQKASDSDKSRLLIEATSWFGEESIPMLTTWLGSKEASPEFKSAVLNHTCEKMRNDRKDVVANSAIQAIGTPDHPKPALAILSCFDSDDARAEPYLKALVKLTCQGGARNGNVPGEMISWNGKATQSPAFIKRRIARDAKQEIEACKGSPGTLFLAALDLPVPETEILSVLRDSEYAEPMTQYLDSNIAAERAGLMHLIAKKEDATKSLKRLVNDDWVATPAELVAVAEQYAPTYHSVLASSDYGRRSTILDIFSFQKNAEARKAALRVFEAAASSADADKLPELRIAMVVLGQREFAVAAAHGLRSKEKHGNSGTGNASGLISYGLILSGCKVDEIADAYRAAITARDSDRGVLCTREK
ncbi:MAG: hypothetical protein K8S54_18525 [Spirochaetia bacterium]|nr:hypothetical protein [Spirochaetia bacterium]